MRKVQFAALSLSGLLAGNELGTLIAAHLGCLAAVALGAGADCEAV